MRVISIALVSGVVLFAASCGTTDGGVAPGAVADGGGIVGPDGCPVTMPYSGDACASEGKSCKYECATGGPGTASCKSGRWGVLLGGLRCPAPPVSTGVDAGPPPADAPFACGSQTCGVNQFCVNPCCGGAAPQCLPLGKNGACLPGFHAALCQGGQGCEADPCTPPPPFCVDSASDPRAQGCRQSDDKSRSLACACG